MDNDGFGSLSPAFDFPQKHLELHADDKSEQETAQANKSVPIVDVLFGAAESGTTLIIKSILE